LKVIGFVNNHMKRCETGTGNERMQSLSYAKGHREQEGKWQCQRAMIRSSENGVVQ
jgi:hypothetical protein